MKRLTRLAVLSLLVPALALPTAGVASADRDERGGPPCWAAGRDCDDEDDDDRDDRDGSLIQGVAVDGAGQGIDNVAVQALDASTGRPVATALTYASPRPTGPQHGYFYLVVEPGVYDVVLVKRGFDASLLQDVNVTGKKDVSLGQLQLDLRDWPTSTVAEVVDPVVTPRQSVKVSTLVDSRRAKVTGGKVVVSEGKRVLATQKLRRVDQGSVTVNVGRLRPGTHRLTVRFKPVDGLKGSSSKTVKVTVARTAAKGAERPLVW